MIWTAPRGRPAALAPYLAVLAVVLLGLELQATLGVYRANEFYGVAVAWALALGALLVRRRATLPPLEWMLAFGVVVELAAFSLRPATIELPTLGPLERPAFAAALVLALALTLWGLGGERAGRWWFPALVAVHFAIGARILWLEKSPSIDVFVVEVDAAKALLSGHNPYAITFANPYPDNTPFYPPGVVVNGRLPFGFVYPPLTLLACLPGMVLAGDPRYGLLAAMSGAALLIGYARPGLAPKLAAALFLFTPSTFYVADRAWTDPTIVLATAAVAFAALRSSRWLFVAIGLYAALKQQMFIGAPALLLALPRPLTPRGFAKVVAGALAVAAAVTLPLVLWDPRAFAKSVLDIREVYRLDSFSLLAHLANLGIVRLWKWSGLVAIVPVIALGLWRAPRRPYGFALLAAATHFTLYFFSTHAFCNEYYNVLGALCLALALAPKSDEEQRGEGEKRDEGERQGDGAERPRARTVHEREDAAASEA